MRRLLALPLVLVLALAGCMVPPDPNRLARIGAQIAIATDDDRTETARIVAGLTAAHAGMSLGCTMLKDMADWRPLQGLRAYCAARP